MKISLMICMQYISAIAQVGRDHHGWLNSEIVPQIELPEASHAVDQHMLQFTFDLWNAMSKLIQEHEVPLPAGKHCFRRLLQPGTERGKGPIDVYSCLKNVKSYHSHLGPVETIWLRLIMTSVYNLFQAYNLSRTERFLKSDECNSFRDFQDFRKRLLPFRQFCHLLANDLIVDVASPFAYDSDDSEEENQTTSNNTKEAGKEVFSYKKRSAYFSNRHLVVKRKNQ